jgi:pyruvate dehydrogenase E2 component (dihydrolipoamide acetyltransferase)
MSTQDAATAALAMRRAIAAAMERSHREIPHYYLAHDIDLGRAVAWLAARNASRTVERRVLLAALLLHTVARCLPRFPELNGHWIDGEHRPAAGIDLGVAISLRSGGLITPCIHGAERLDLDGTMLALGDLAGRARSGRLRSSDLAGGTITVSNLGDLGADSVFGLIYPPQVALVGFGRVVERCVAHEGMLGVRPVLRATLAGDHRASDGHRGGLFLAALDHALQEPTP